MPAKTMDQAMQLQSVYYGDCVKHLQQWRALNFELLSSARSLADLIYLDPPWNSNANYNILWDKDDHADHGHTAQATAFTDIWEWDDGSAERVQELIQAGNLLHAGHPNRKNAVKPASPIWIDCPEWFFEFAFIFSHPSRRHLTFSIRPN